MLNAQQSETRGAVILESVFVIIVVTTIIGFILDAGLILYRYSSLTDTTAVVAHELAIDLGRAWHNNQIASAPWSGSCNSYLRDTGRSFVANRPEVYSFDDANATFYLGSTIDDSTALVAEAGAPYAILRIVGKLKPNCIICSFFPHLEVKSESSVLVEYHQSSCNDY